MTDLLEKIRPVIQQQINSLSAPKPAFGGFLSMNQQQQQQQQQQDEILKKAKSHLEIIDSQISV